MTERIPRSSRLTKSERQGIIKDIKSNRGAKFCINKWNISENTYYKYKRIVKAEEESTETTGKQKTTSPEQELQILKINAHLAGLADDLIDLWNEVIQMDHIDGVFIQKFKVGQDLVDTMDKIRHGIMAYEIEEMLEDEDREMPPDLMEKLVERLSEDEVKELLFNEQSTEESAGPPVPAKEKEAKKQDNIQPP